MLDTITKDIVGNLVKTIIDLMKHSFWIFYFYI